MPKTTFWWTLLALMAPNVALCFTEHLTLLQSATNVILPLGIYWALLSISRRVGLAVWLMLALMVIAAFQIVLLFLYGSGIIAVDMYLNVVTTNTQEAGELLIGLWPALIIVAILYIPPLVGATISLIRRLMLSRNMLVACRRCARLAITLGLILLCLSFFASSAYNPLRQLFPLNAAYNLALAIGRDHAQKHYASSARDFSFHTTPADSIPGLTVIIIGETSRASSWQLLGYHRPTNPLLSKADGLIIFPHALSQSNTTHKSVPLMLSHLDARSFGDSIYMSKGVLAAFSESGCPATFISNQERNGALIDAFGQQGDSAIFLADSLPHSRTDLDLLPYLDHLIAQCQKGEKSLLVVHTYGSHYCYSDRYPDSLAAFTPDRPLEASPECRHELINAYDNSIRLTDRLLSDIIATLSRCKIPSSLIFTSDHGEDIFDDSRQRFLHASPIPTFEQLHVPLLIWMSPDYRRLHPDRFLAARANSRRAVSTSSSLFHSVLALAGIDAPIADPSLSLLSNTYSPPSYLYLDDHNEAVEPAAAGFDPVDIRRIDTLYTAHINPAIPHAKISLHAQNHSR
ncbi:MAG: lipid A phosphoethanolamine transferase [Pseudoflavonifractor sp.]|nr:lipid A phosphoethanolamine transferase [Pseudoflavonifractor sp.]